MAKDKEPSEIKTVEMEDGRKVDFVGKRKMLKEVGVDAHGHPTVKLDFANGKTRTFKPHPELITRFAAHGMAQKYGDETAGVSDVDDMVDAVDELHSRLAEGKWSEAREGGGIAGTSVLARALVEFHGGKKSVEEIKVWLKTKSQAEKTAMRANPKLVPIIQRIEAEKANAGNKVDTDALLAELG